MTLSTIAATPASGLSALLGLGTGAGLLLVVRGWRAPVDGRPSLWRRTWDRHAPGAYGDRHRILRLGLALAAGVLTGLATGWVVGAVLATLAVWALPRLLGRDPEQARRVARIEAIATWTEMLRDTLTAAAGLNQAILATAPLAPAAIRGEIGELAASLENGIRLAPALRALATRLTDPTADLVIAALVLAAEHHARHLADLLGSLAHTAREQASMRLRVEAGRARTRTSVRVIVGTTLTFATSLTILNRPYLSAFDTVVGQIVLLGIGVLFGLGFAWLSRIARSTNEPDRFLHTEGSPPAEMTTGRAPLLTEIGM
ncbi:type II secretion system F family protein [Amycolatopsis pigmentata]|uniref:Type II secretion system F family protein n=1 Tax=Amycolatopsis pigmentata TaxID=450801 RepID=A0ABW5FMF2_9PSEU